MDEIGSMCHCDWDDKWYQILERECYDGEDYYLLEPYDTKDNSDIGLPYFVVAKGEPKFNKERHRYEFYSIIKIGYPSLRVWLGENIKGYDNTLYYSRKFGVN